MIWTNLAPLFGVAGLIFALGIFLYVKKQPVGTDAMAELSEMIYDGAMVYLKRQYIILAGFIVIVFGLLYWQLGPQTASAFLAGALCSIMAGFCQSTDCLWNDWLKWGCSK